ncbi:MAG: hypothetical protein QOI07_1912 [Verrucomicrobiota bacterium]
MLTLGLSVFLYFRLPDFVASRNGTIDVFAFLMWAALLLAPVFQEVAFFGVSLKQELREAKNEIREQLLELKADIHNTVDVHPNINVFAPAPPPDAALPKLEEQAKRVVREQRKLRAVPEEQAKQPIVEVPEAAKYLFGVRYTIEQELRRLMRSRLADYQGFRPLTAFQMVRVLLQAELLDSHLGEVVREVLAVCSPAIHGDDVSEAKRKFVADIAPELIDTLRSLS